MYQKATTRNQVTEGKVTGVEVDGKEVALYSLGDEIFATTDVCTHANCLLSISGDVYDDIVECSCHGSGYDIRTGNNVQPPSSDPLKTYTVKIQGDDVLVDID